MVGSAITLLGKQILLSAFDGGAPAGGFGTSPAKTEHEDAEKKVTVEEKATEKAHEGDEALTEEHDSEDVKSKNGGIGETDQPDKNTKEKTSKKPDKILPCPRCKSMETKFCYYNNYNVNQPRHFCKACQRYWTSGGTMRTMPVGAGRRKNKNSSSAYRHITVSEAYQPVRINGNVISFEKIEGQSFPAPRVAREISDDGSSLSSVTVSDSADEGVKQSSKKQYFHNHHVGPSYLPFFPGVSWTCSPPGFPISIYPGSSPPWFPGWPSSPSNSPTIGKHSRDSDMFETCTSDDGEQGDKRRPGSVLVPKTLRIGNPDDAAKSSIWATLGIKNESSIGREDMFKDFRSKTVERTCFSERSSVLQANPAALTRSLTFHETA